MGIVLDKFMASWHGFLVDQYFLIKKIKHQFVGRKIKTVTMTAESLERCLWICVQSRWGCCGYGEKEPKSHFPWSVAFSFVFLLNARILIHNAHIWGGGLLNHRTFFPQFWHPLILRTISLSCCTNMDVSTRKMVEIKRSLPILWLSCLYIL